jgi:hypothetical protein
LVGDYHQITNFKLGVGAACSIADEQCFDTQLIHDTNGKSDLLHGVAFIVMKSAFHGQDVFVSQFSEDKITRMPFYRRDWEVGNFFV